MEFEKGDKVEIISQSTIEGKPDSFSNREIGTKTEIQYIYGSEDEYVGIKCSDKIIDKSCLRKIHDKIKNWREELE